MKTKDPLRKKGIMIFYLSFVPLLFHVGSHLVAGSYFPAVVTVVIISGIAIHHYLAPHKIGMRVKFWSFLLLGNALLRTLLAILVFVAGEGVPSSIYYQLDVWLLASILAHGIIGYWLLANSGNVFWQASKLADTGRSEE